MIVVVQAAVHLNPLMLHILAKGVKVADNQGIEYSSSSPRGKHVDGFFAQQRGWAGGACGGGGNG